MAGNEDQPPGRLIRGRYEVLRELGRGGMGVVWLADDTLAGRQVAVKELRPPHGLADADRAVLTRRALQEARSAARIKHPNAVTLYDVLPATAGDDAVYLVMELIDGPTLAQLIRRKGRLPDATVAAVGLQLLDVLAAAHKLDIVHRDIKPGNIMVAAGNQVKLADFGIAHTVGDVRITLAGVMGTQAYMAPELFDSKPVISPAADLWSLGASLYCAAAGHGPFDRDATSATLRAILLDDMPVPTCSPGLAAAITSLLQRDPQQRAAKLPQARAQLSRAAADTASRGPASSGQDRWDERDTHKQSGPPSGVLPPPPSGPTTFTNTPSPSALKLARAVYWIALIGAFGGLFTIPWPLKDFFFVPLIIVWIIATAKMSGWRKLVLDANGFTTWRVNEAGNLRPHGAGRWEQVTGIASSGPRAARLSARIKAGKSQPTKEIRLCPVGSPHFPISDILTAIQSYCPTVTIESSARALVDGHPDERK